MAPNWKKGCPLTLRWPRSCCLLDGTFLTIASRAAPNAIAKERAGGSKDASLFVFTNLAPPSRLRS